jgi:hypothetical protein
MYENRSFRILQSDSSSDEADEGSSKFVFADGFGREIDQMESVYECRKVVCHLVGGSIPLFELGRVL